MKTILLKYFQTRLYELHWASQKVRLRQHVHCTDASEYSAKVRRSRLLSYLHMHTTQHRRTRQNLKLGHLRTTKWVCGVLLCGILLHMHATFFATTLHDIVTSFPASAMAPVVSKLKSLEILEQEDACIIAVASLVLRKKRRRRQNRRWWIHPLRQLSDPSYPNIWTWYHFQMWFCLF